MRAFKHFLSLLISFALLAWFFGGEHASLFLEALTRFQFSTLLIAALGLAASYVLRTLRVYEEFRHDAQKRFGACLRIVLIHNAMVNIIPFRGGEAAFPVLLQRTFNTALPRAIASLFWFRLQDAVVVALVATLFWPGLPLLLRGAGIAALFLFIWFLQRWARRHSATGTHHRFFRLQQALGESISRARLGWFWTVANWSVKLLTQAWLLATLLQTGLATGISGALGAELAAILPVQGVAGFGTYEAGAAAALFTAGINFETGLQAALALHFVIIGCATLAGLSAALWHAVWQKNVRPAPPLSDTHFD